MGFFGNLSGGDYTDIRRRDVEEKCIGYSECKTRKATPEELEHYFGKTAQNGGGGRQAIPGRAPGKSGRESEPSPVRNHEGRRGHRGDGAWMEMRKIRHIATGGKSIEI